MRNFAPFLLLIFGVAVLLRVDFFFTVAYFLVGIYLLVRVWNRRAAEHLRVQREFVNRAFTGDRVPVSYSIHNEGWLPVPWLEVTESVPLPLQSDPVKSFALSLRAHETWRNSYTLHCRSRGYYLLGPLLMQTGDLLGIERQTRLRVAPVPMLVYPRVVPLPELGIPTRSPLVALPARSPLFEDSSRLMGVRAYQRGDSPRRIHWPASARTSTLVVKQYQPAIARETLICLDMARSNYNPRRMYEATELAIITAASLANHIVIRDKLPVGLATEAEDPIVEETRRISVVPRSERAHLVAGIMEPLARIQSIEMASLSDLLRSESVRLSWGSTIAVITGSESEDLYDSLLVLQRSGFSVTLVLVHPEPTPPGLRGRAEALGVTTHRVRTERDLETWM
ncbi:MAG: DUF58 domain-containing protein [Chloroflexota bacterium]|nr:DUF58 domain-containing protein [Chloroflexota bacterium]